MPETDRAARLEELNRALRAWRQGDVGRPGVFVSLVRRDLPLEPGAAAQARSETDDYFLQEYTVEAFVVLSQTCDIVKAVGGERGSRYWVRVAPLVTLTGSAASEARSGRAARYAPVPGEGQDAFADLDRCTSIEKAVLVQASRTPGCPTDDARRAFGEAVARNLGRFAFPDALDDALKPLKLHMRKRAGKASPEGRCVDALVQLRVESDREWDDLGARITVHFIVGVESLPPIDDELLSAVRDLSDVAAEDSSGNVAARIEEASADPLLRQALWQRLAETWAEMCTPNEAVAEVIGLPSSEAEFTLMMMRSAPQLDLEHLSPDDEAIR